MNICSIYVYICSISYMYINEYIRLFRGGLFDHSLPEDTHQHTCTYARRQHTCTQVTAAFHVYTHMNTYMIFRIMGLFASRHASAHVHTRSQTTTGCRILIGCLKLQVILCKRATDYRALLQKITCKDKASYDSTPPCNSCISYINK